MAVPTVVNQNAPITAASIVSAFSLCLAAFTNLTAEQVTALNAVVAIVAAVAVQRYHTEPRA